MHAVFFGIKRVHLRVITLTRPLLEAAGLTPARFDMLRIISLYPHGIMQSNIRYLLGVSAATVSRMLKSLQLLGLVVRRTYERDGRCRLVTITEVGIDSMRRALHDTIDSRVAEAVAAKGVTGDRAAFADSPAVRHTVTKFEDLLVRMRRVYEDPSPVRHPWRGGSLTPMAFTTLVDGRLSYDIGCAS